MSYKSEQQHSFMSTPSPLVWFLLLDAATGEPYKGTTADKVALSSTADVADFRDAVKAKFSNKLSSVDAGELHVYKNKAAFDKRNAAVDEGKEVPLKSSFPLNGLGIAEEDALIVVVPSSRDSSESSLFGKEPNPKRKQRWIELNEILEGNAKKSKTNDSTAYSYVTWNQVKAVFNPTYYVQQREKIDDAQLNFLAQYLSIAAKCFGDITTGKEAKRLHFIAPVLICVCILFKGDVDIVVEEDLIGNFVKAHGHFEFMLRHGNKAVCIVEAKKTMLNKAWHRTWSAARLPQKLEGWILFMESSQIIFSGISFAVAMIRWRWKNALCALRRMVRNESRSRKLLKRFMGCYQASKLSVIINCIYSNSRMYFSC